MRKSIQTSIRRHTHSHRRTGQIRNMEATGALLGLKPLLQR